MTLVQEFGIISPIGDGNFHSVRFTGFPQNNDESARLITALKRISAICIDFGEVKLKQADLDAFNVFFVDLCQYPNISKLFLPKSELVSNETISDISKLQLLNELTLDQTGVFDLQVLTNLKHLERLYLRATRVRSVNGLAELDRLKLLNLERNSELKSFTATEGFSFLEDLVLDKSGVANVEISGLPKLQRLYLNDTSRLAKLELSVLPMLTTLQVSGSRAQLSLILSQLSALEQLDITSNYELLELEIRDLPNLERLTIQDNDSLRSLLLESLPNLNNPSIGIPQEAIIFNSSGKIPGLADNHPLQQRVRKPNE